MASGLTSTDFNYDNLVIGDFPLLTRAGTLLSGQNVVRGAILGKESSEGKYKLSLTASTDGSEVPVAIAAEACDASLGDKKFVVYESGEFNEDRVTVGTGHSIATIRDAMRAIGIYFRKPLPR